MSANLAAIVKDTSYFISFFLLAMSFSISASSLKDRIEDAGAKLERFDGGD